MIEINFSELRGRKEERRSDSENCMCFYEYFTMPSSGGVPSRLAYHYSELKSPSCQPIAAAHDACHLGSTTHQVPRDRRYRGMIIARPIKN